MQIYLIKGLEADSETSFVSASWGEEYCVSGRFSLGRDKRIAVVWARRAKGGDSLTKISNSNNGMGDCD